MARLHTHLKRVVSLRLPRNMRQRPLARFRPHPHPRHRHRAQPAVDFRTITPAAHASVEVYPMATAQVRFACSQCAKQYSTPSSFAGKTVNCTCGMKLTVPSANAAAQPKPPVPQKPQPQPPTTPYGNTQPTRPTSGQQPYRNVVSNPGTSPGYPTKYCHACGQVVDARAEICPHCGVRQPDVAGPNGGAQGEQKNRLVAALLALLLGGLGAHHFYLGRPILGVIYLLFCWTLIPPLIALIEGLVLLCTSDRAFAQRYSA